MRSSIHARFRDSADSRTAESILKACVHCGFCNATCPTYLELGDERDGPRGRIYLIRQLLESGEASERTRTHLDRCLTCRNCETTCPSGVSYGRLLDIGRGVLEQDLRRSPIETCKRALIRFFVPHPRRFSVLLGLARTLRFVLPRTLRAKIPRSQGWPGRSQHPSADRSDAQRRMIILEGCVQSVATPATNAATRRVLDRLGISVVAAERSGCCGALDYHLGNHDEGKAFMRANIDAWWPHIRDGAQAIVSTASGCGATIREYGNLLADDPAYAEKARQVSSLARDIVEVLDAEDLDRLEIEPVTERLAVHCPCTLQHALKLGPTLEKLLTRLGLDLVDTNEGHLCCGSAGSYSLLQPQLSERLRERKLDALTPESPDVILTANVGCQLHLAAGTDVPVRHWIEAIDASLGDSSREK